MERDSPTKPETATTEAEVPDEDACVASNILSSADTEPHGVNPSSPVSCGGTSEQSDFGATVDPSEIVTQEMVEEENILEAEAVKKEEERNLQAQKLLEEVSDTTTEQRYERLKYLLSKSTMYTEYLVDRMKKQKEEEEKRRKRIMQRRAIKEEKLKKEGTRPSNTANSESRDTRNTKGRKRKSCDVDDSQEIENESDKKLNDAQTKVSEETIETSEFTKKLQDESPQLNEKCVESNIDQQPSLTSELDAVSTEEPHLLEKASTFGINGTEKEDKRFINGEEIPHLQPMLMDGGVLRPYQVEGYSWLKVLWENGVNGILADEMGLGKTVQCVAILAHLVQMGIPGPFLVCAPLSTIPNWFAEFQRFASKVPTILYHGHKDHRAELSTKIRKKHKISEGVYVQPVVITSYEIAMIDRKFLAHNDWKYLIVDEGHRIKNTHCRLIRELRMYNSTHRLLLTGTPLQNNLAELWSLLNFLLPEIFDDSESFETWFDATCMSDQGSDEQIVQQEQGKNILSMLHQILTPFMLRRLKSDVDLCIPPKKELLVYAPLTQLQREFYSALVDRTIFNKLEEKNKVDKPVELNAAGHPKRRSSKKIDYSLMMETKAEKRDGMSVGQKRWKNLEAEEKELESWIYALSDVKNKREAKEEKVKTSQVTIKMRNVMMQLRKCCNHPYLLEHPIDPKNGELALTEEVISSSGKMMLLDRMLVELKKKGHRVLIFSQMTRLLDLIEDFCYLRKYEYCRLDGSTHVDDRRDSMNIFNAKKSDKFLFLLSTRAGGLGVNLTGADTVIIYDSDWNPQCDLQAQDRCHRIGQTKPVVVYRFITANTIDQKIIERAAAKRKLEKMVIHKGKFKSGNFTVQPKAISPEELRELLQSKDYLEITDNKFVISKTEMDFLMDRSDLYALWEKNKAEKGSKKETTLSPPKKKQRLKREGTAESDLFKVVDVDDGTFSTCSEENETT